MGESDDLHDAAAHVGNGNGLRAIASLVKAVAVIASDVRELKEWRREQHDCRRHQSEPEHDIP